ncbi:MAG TPA: class I SAM-dependent methyltransferase [Stellaceae bacterium]|nr:class I SAM-dependent methyltransferase [Stellaceae bacterium]
MTTAEPSLDWDADKAPPQNLVDRLRPEIRAGGYARDDGTIHFFTRVNALLEPQMTVVDLGAGRGRDFQRDPDAYMQRLAKLQGKVARVIGIDVDDAILGHPFLDERHVVAPTAAWPLADGSVDMVVANWVLEHLRDPEFFAAELHRVLKPGGWLCAHTVNRWGYVGIGARAVPNSLHARFLKGLWPGRNDIDVFSVQYKLNSLSDLRRRFPVDAWDNCSYRASFVPKYTAESPLLFHLFAAWQRIGTSSDLLVFIRKK